MHLLEKGDLLKDLDEKIIPAAASKGTRFVNYMIDIVLAVVFYHVVARIGLVVLSLTMADVSALYFQAMRDFFYLAVPFYFILTEGIFKGQTPGKMITGTVAIRIDGSTINWENALLRSLCRFVPFEVFSGFFEPWHDRWTSTTVVMKKDLLK